MKLTKNFTLEEFRCKDAAGTMVPQRYRKNVQELANNLQVLRDYINEPIFISSGYRTPAHNRKVKGAKDSQHPLAKAGDLTTNSKTPKQLYAIIEKLIKEGKMKQGGLGLYPSFVHYDIRGYRARWVG